MPSSNPKPPDPALTLARMKVIAQGRTTRAVTGAASVDILAPHCGIALFFLSRGAMVVSINGEATNASPVLPRPQAFEEFDRRRAALREAGPVPQQKHHR